MQTVEINAYWIDDNLIFFLYKTIILYSSTFKIVYKCVIITKQKHFAMRSKSSYQKAIREKDKIIDLIVKRLYFSDAFRMVFPSFHNVRCGSNTVMMRISFKITRIINVASFAFYFRRFFPCPHRH